MTHFDDEYDWHGQPDCSASAIGRAKIAALCLGGCLGLAAVAAFAGWW